MTLFDYANIRIFLIVRKYFKEKITHKTPPYFSCFTDLFEHIRTLTASCPNPDAPSHSRVEFQLDLLWGPPSSGRPTTDIGFTDRKGLIALKKVPEFIAEKKPKLFPKNFRRRTDQSFSDIFQETFPRNEHEKAKTKPCGKSRVQPKMIDPPRQASTLSSSRTYLP